MVLFIGFGALAKSVLALSETKEDIYVFNRRKELIKNEKDSRIRLADAKDFKQATRVFIFLPSDAYGAFFKEYLDAFSTNATFYYFATALQLEQVKKLIPNRTVIPCKCIGQAEQMEKDKKGLFLVPHLFEKEKIWISNWFGSDVEVVDGNEETALYVNQLATESAIRMAVALKKELEEKGVPQEIINQTIGITSRGVISSFIQGRLGHFAKQIQQHVEKGE